MPAGRPSKLTPEAIEKAKAYIDGGYADYGHTIPSHAGLAVILSVGKATIYRWAEQHPAKFRDILVTCNAVQEQLLISHGLSGDYNSAIAKLVLGKHGYHERQEHSGPDGEKLEITIVRHGGTK